MMESSDNSFLWTSASSDSDSGKPSSPKPNMSPDILTNYEEENESFNEKKYKKKLQKLLKDNNKVKDCEKKKRKHSEAFSNNECHNDKTDDSQMKIGQNDEGSEHSNETSTKKKKKKIKRLADIIKYEVESDSNYQDVSNTNCLTNEAKMLNDFMKEHPELKVMPLSQQSPVSGDHDIWVVNAPAYFDLESVRGKSLSLDNKSKIKTETVKYDVTFEHDPSLLPVLQGQNSWLCDILRCKGVFNIRQRLPRIELCDENILREEESGPIELPETKHRHPLLGRSYKELLQLAPAVQKRLDRVTRKRQKNIS